MYEKLTQQLGVSMYRTCLADVFWRRTCGWPRFNEGRHL